MFLLWALINFYFILNLKLFLLGKIGNIELSDFVYFCS